MTRDEMQRFLDLEALRGADELEAYRNLIKVIGISYQKPGDNQEKK